LQRVGARGLPFFMIRVDRAGQVSKRYRGASDAPIVDAPALCPLWRLHHAFDRPGEMIRHLVALEDGGRWFTIARTAQPPGRGPDMRRAIFAVGLGLAADLARPLALARGLDLGEGAATPIGLGCRHCTRVDCLQRSAPPLGRALVINERERGLTPFGFAGD
jgi:predicted transcriptional regulator